LAKADLAGTAVHRRAAQARSRLARDHQGAAPAAHHRGRPAATRAPDLVKRNFKASRPGELVVADFTYVPMDTSRFGYTAFVIDAFAGFIPGWECSLSKKTAFVEAAIRQAAAFRARQGHPVHRKGDTPLRCGKPIHECSFHRDPDARRAATLHRDRRRRI